MTGLERILEQIKLDTDNTCTDIYNGALAQEKEIIDASNKSANKIKTSAFFDAKLKKEKIINRAKSTAVIERKNIILKAKQQIIRDMLIACREYILNLSQKEYFALITKMIIKYSDKDKSGTVCFSMRDLRCFPSGFICYISEISHGKLFVSEVPENIDGGFILKYGNVEINCSLISIFNSQSEEFSDAASGILFG